MSEGLYFITHASTGVLKKSCLLKAVQFPLAHMTWLCGMWGSCSTAAKHIRFLVCDTVSLGEWSLLIQRILMPSSSRINSPRSLGLLESSGWRHHDTLKHHKPIAQWHSVTYQKIWSPNFILFASKVNILRKKNMILIINDRQYTHFKLTRMFKFVEIRF